MWNDPYRILVVPENPPHVVWMAPQQDCFFAKQSQQVMANQQVAFWLWENKAKSQIFQNPSCMVIQILSIDWTEIPAAGRPKRTQVTQNQ